MPSVLDLFGELGLKTDQFDRTLKGSVAQMKAADAQLNKVIAVSNKLGDTSATVARRYEKLSDGIATQRRRLIEAANAFERGDINAKKFQSTIDSVSKSVDGLNSRVKDANARVTELSETGFTHFQNQIRGGITPSQSNDLFKRLSTFQKTQLSFQINDIITGLASGQNPLQILAQQGGQIFQIFQQTPGYMKNAAESAGVMATATRSAAVASKETAVATQATALASAEAAGSMTLFGVAVIPAVAALAAGAAIILSAKKLSEDILKASQERLKVEEAIVGALNKQNIAAAELKDRLKEEAGKRGFDRLTQSDDLRGLKQAREDLQRSVAETRQGIRDEVNRRAELAERFGFTGPVATAYVKAGGETKAQTEELKRKEDQISALAARIEELQRPQSSQDFIKGIQSRQIENLKKNIDVAVKEQQKAREAAKQIIEQQNKEETALLQNKYKAQEAALKLHLQTTAASQAKSIVATSALQAREIDSQIASTRRYYNALIANAKDATERQQAESNKRIAIANLEAQKQIEAIEKVRRLHAESLQQFSRFVAAADLRSQAQEFSQGFKNEDDPAFARRARYFASVVARVGDSPETFKANYERYLAEEKATGVQSAIAQKLAAIGGPQTNAALEAARQQAIIAATAGADPATLTSGQNRVAAEARRREADRIEKERNDINRQLIEAIRSGHIVRVIDEAKSARVTRRPSSADSANYYTQ